MLAEVLALLLIIGVFGIVIERKIGNLLTIFSFVWALVVYLSSLKLYNQVGYTDKVYSIVMLGEISFFIGYMFFHFFSRGSKGGLQISNLQKNFGFNISLFKKCLFVCHIFYIVIAIRVLILIASGVTWYTIRYIYFQGGLLYSGIFAIFVTWFATPICQYLAFPILILSYASGRKDKALTYLTISNCAMVVFASGGKGVIFIFLVYLIMAFVILRQQLSKKTKFIFEAVAIFVIIVVVGLQYIRSFSSLESNFIYNYFGITLPLMDYWIDYIESQPLRGYGDVFLHGVLNIPLSFFEIVFPGFFSHFENTSELMDIIASKGVKIFSDKGPTTNVYVSMYTYFYLDGGLFCVGLFSFILGTIAKIGHNSLLKKQDGFHFIMFLLVSVLVIDSFIKWEAYTSSFVLAFIYLYLFLKIQPQVQYVALPSRNIKI